MDVMIMLSLRSEMDVMIMLSLRSGDGCHDHAVAEVGRWMS